MILLVILLGTIYYEVYLLQVSTIHVLEKFEMNSSLFIITLIFTTLIGAYIMNEFDNFIIAKATIRGDNNVRDYKK